MSWTNYPFSDGGYGIPGPAGPPGESAYDVAVAEGFLGTEAEWLVSLVGEDGVAGAAGESAYATAVAGGFVGTQAEWLASLVGPTGLQGPAGGPGPEGPAGPAGSDLIWKVSDFLAQPIGFIAHRGSGGEFPEHNRVGHIASVGALSASGRVAAVEVSVVSAADKTIFCQHDLTFPRTTTGTGSTTSLTWSQIRNTIRSKESDFLGAGWEALPLTPLQEALDYLHGKAIVFLEPKDNAAVAEVKQLVLNYKESAADWIVWKGYFQNATIPWGFDNGFTTWAYVDAGTTDAEMDLVDPSVSMWGVPHAMSDTRIAEIVARGKKVICWEVHRRSDVTRLTALGVWGMMCSRVLYVTRVDDQFGDLRIRASDSFAGQIAQPGNIGRIGMDRTHQLSYTSTGEAYFATASQRSSVMGELSMVPPPANYTIRFSQMWPVLPPAQTHSGIAWGKVDDDAYLFGVANPSGGYHIAFRGNGDFQLYRHDPGVSAGVKLGEALATQAPVAGTYATFEVQMTSTTVVAIRTDVTPNITLAATDNTYRGGCFHLSTGSVTVNAQSPRWRAVDMNTV